LLKIIRDGIEVPTYFILIGSVVAIALIVEHFLTVRAATIAPLEQLKHARQQIEGRISGSVLTGCGRAERSSRAS